MVRGAKTQAIRDYLQESAKLGTSPSAADAVKWCRQYRHVSVTENLYYNVRGNFVMPSAERETAPVAVATDNHVALGDVLTVLEVSSRIGLDNIKRLVAAL